MIFVLTERFKKAFQSLPKDIQKKTACALGYLAEDTFYPSLGAKKVHSAPGIWEVRIDLNYRVTFQLDDEVGKTICLLRNVDNNHDA